MASPSSSSAARLGTAYAEITHFEAEVARAATGDRHTWTDGSE